MTNEQLATFIHTGGNDELIPLLWEKVQRFVYRKAAAVYTLHTESCRRRGVELCDIKQAGYMAFLEAIKGYKPETEYKFITFINLPFKNAVNELLKLRTRSGFNDPLNNCISLDTPAEDKDGETDTTIKDIQADKKALNFVNDLEAAELSNIIRKELEKLTEKQADIIRRFYLEGQSLKDIAKNMNISGERVRQIKSAAECELKKNRTLKRIYEEHYKNKHYFHYQ